MSGNTVFLSSTATEVSKGVNYSNRRAVYHSGSGTDTLRFKYTVEEGDKSDDLESIKLEVGAVQGEIYKAGSSTVKADVSAFPTGNQRYRYMESRGTSLSFNRAISVDTSTPTVLLVQPMSGVQTANTFGVGEEVFISAVFSHNVTVSFGDQSTRPYLVLETGSINRRAYYLSTILGNVVNFKYTVEAGDSTADLDYASVSALTIPPGAYIRRSSTNPTTDVDTTLPLPSNTNSLADKGQIAVDTTTPKVDRVTASASMNLPAVIDGTTKLAAGDEVYIEVKFNFPVTITGSPRLYVYTGAAAPIPQETIVAVPEDSKYAFDPNQAKTGGVVGINVNFNLVNALSAGEIVELHLPGFGSGVSNIGNLTMVARHPVTYKPLPISGAWDSASAKVVLTANSNVLSTNAPLNPASAAFPDGISVEIDISASNGLNAPLTGVRQGSNGEAGIYLTTNSAAGTITSPPTYPYPQVNTGVGIASAEILSFTPAVAGAATRMILNVTHVSELKTSSSAAINIELPGFTADASLGALAVTDEKKTLVFSVSASFSGTPTITLTATSDIDAMSHHLVKIQGIALPASGVSPDSASAIKVGINQNNEVPSLVRTVPGVGFASSFSFGFGAAAELGVNVPVYVTGTIKSGGLATGDQVRACGGKEMRAGRCLRFCFLRR